MKEIVSPPIDAKNNDSDAPRRLETSNDWHTWSTNAIVNENVVEGTSRVNSV